MTNLEEILKQLLRENNQGNYNNQQSNALDVTSMELPSPIKRRKINISHNIINRLKIAYEKAIMNSTPVAKNLLENNKYNEPSLHSDKEGLKNQIRFNLKKLNSEFEVIRMTNEERLMASESFSFSDASIIHNLETMWEIDRTELSFLEMALKWKITIPDNIELAEDVIATYRTTTENNTIIYNINTYEMLLEVDIIY